MKFNSKALQESFEQAKPILEGLKPQDPISEDIQELEQFLQTMHLKESFTFNLKNPQIPAHHEELLIWNHHRQQLMYNKNSYKVTCLSHEKGYSKYIDYNNKEILLESQLIDAPASVKHYIAKEDKLALFLSCLTHKLKQVEQELVYF